MEPVIFFAERKLVTYSSSNIFPFSFIFTWNFGIKQFTYDYTYFICFSAKLQSSAPRQYHPWKFFLIITLWPLFFNVTVKCYWRTNVHSLIQLLILHPLVSLFSGQRKSNILNYHQNFPWQFTKLWNSVLLKDIFMVPFSCFIQYKSSVIHFKTNLGQENVFSMIKSLLWVVLRNRTHTWSVLSSIILSKTTGLPWRRLPAVWCTVATVCQRFCMIV